MVSSVLVGNAGNSPVAGVPRDSFTKVLSKTATSYRSGAGALSELSEQATITVTAQHKNTLLTANAGQRIFVVMFFVLSVSEESQLACPAAAWTGK